MVNGKSFIKSKAWPKGQGDWAKMVRLRNECTGDEITLGEAEHIAI